MNIARGFTILYVMAAIGALAYYSGLLDNWRPILRFLNRFI